MRKHVLIFGLVLGAVMAANMVYMVNLLYSKPDFKSNEVLGYAAMVVIFSLIFFGVRNYRNRRLGGVISFGKAFKTGALIAVFASTIYVITWLFTYYLFVPDYIDKYAAHVLDNCEASDLAGKTREMENLKDMYKSPVFVILITFSEVLPVGLLVALVSALVLKRKDKKPASPAQHPITQS